MFLNNKGDKTQAEYDRMKVLEQENASMRKGRPDESRFEDLYQQNGVLSQREYDFAQFLINQDKYKRLVNQFGAGSPAIQKQLDSLNKANDAIRNRYSVFDRRGGDVFIPYAELLQILGVADRYGTNIARYANGGIDIRGGLAMLHGSISSPEYIYNTPQMREIESIIKKATYGAVCLARPQFSGTQSQPNALHIENLINVEGRYKG